MSSSISPTTQMLSPRTMCSPSTTCSGSGVQDLLNALLGDVGLAVPDLVELVHLSHQHLHSKLHLRFVQRKVEASDLGARNCPGHLLGGDGAVERVAVDQH